MEEKRYEVATFAGGCFWCMVSPFDQQPGIIKVESGYTGGTTSNPTYEQVCSEETGHREAVRITFDPEIFPYERLLEIFWQQIDPTDPGGQFYDRGHSYKTAIFYHNERQKLLAEQSKERLEKSGRFAKPIVTEILPAHPFYPAEEYHQAYYRKKPDHYIRYRRGSGRDAFREKHWPEQPSQGRAKQKLTATQYQVTYENATEPPFANEYWDNQREGIYVDVVTGKPLFSSKDKFDAGCGWPSFTKPLVPEAVTEKRDLSHGMTRTEVRSKYADTHLGHVFNDGPGPTGQRYCINSAALRFIPKEDLEKEGYGQYRRLFDNE